jgi:transcriptional regulator with XRE-family HTH domain
MVLAELCDTSGNYIGEIEMGRRIPSFEKIEKIALALRISSYELFVQESADAEKAIGNKEREQKAKDFLAEISPGVKEEIASRLLLTIGRDIEECLDSKNY